MKHVKPRTRITTFHPIKKERFEKLAKNSKPGPTSYDSPAAIRKTQWSPPKGKVAMKNIKGSMIFLDKLIREKKNIPGVGQYKNVEKAFDLSFRRIKRGKY